MTTKIEQVKTDSNYLRGTLKESLKNPITGSLAENDQILIKFHGIYQQDDRDRRQERAEKKLEKLYSFMLRLRISGGKISAKQWIGINNIADENSTGIIKVTTRQTVQLHGIVKSKVKPTVQWFDKYNLDSIAACGDVNRNVISSATIEKNKAYEEVYKYSAKISDYLLPKTKGYHDIWLDGKKISKENESEPIYGKTYLPRKFKIALAIPPDNDVDVYAHDIGLIAIIENEGLKGFNITIGGGMGSTHGDLNTYPRTGTLIGYVDTDNLLDVVREIVITQRNYGNREDRKQARLKYTIDRLGVDFFVRELEKKVGFKLENAKKFDFIARKDYYGWAEDYLGKYHYTLFIENGRIYDTKSSKLKTVLLEIAKKDYADFRFTSHQNIIISNVDKDNKNKISKLLKSYNINNNISKIRSNSMACVALNTCPLALAEGQRYMPELISKIEPILIKYKIDNEEISIRMTGCPNGCARPFVSEIGLVGRSLGRYNLYFGGSNIGNRINKLYKQDLNEKEILTELDYCFKLYAQKKYPKENFGDFTLRQLKYDQSLLTTLSK